MNKKLGLVFLFCLIIVGIGYSQKDSIIIRNLKCVPDTMVNGIHGIAISYNSTLGYDTLYHKQKSPTAVKLLFSIKSKNTAIACKRDSYKYCNKNNQVEYSKEIRFARGKSELILIPYYILQLPEGTQLAKIELSALISDTSIFENTLNKLKISGDDAMDVRFTKPPVEDFSVLVSGVKLMNTDFKGKAWDYNLVSGTAPDICWKVIAGEGESYNVLFHSSVMKNAYSAAWLDWAEDISLSVGDQFCISVYDNDPFNDDFAGSICGTLSQILQKVKLMQPMAFGRLTYFTFMITPKEIVK